MKLSSDDFNSITRLYIQQDWLLGKKEELYELINFCETSENKKLIFSLLQRFSYLNNKKLSFLYQIICEHILQNSGFQEDKTQLLSLTWDDEADSSQKVLDNLKNPIYKAGWRNVKTVNTFGKSIKNYNEGKTQILIIDEFVGSGQTLRGRINYLKKNIPGKFDVKCCFIAGIKENIDLLKAEGIDIFCALELEKGLSGYYKDDELHKAILLMLGLELKLAQNIKTKDLYQYSFGYGEAEALYSMEGAIGNTPNSVFPIFWWLKDKQFKDRNTILTRVESGF